MSKSTKTIEIKLERIIPAALGEVFDAWLNPEIPGNPWNAAEKFILDPKVDGLFYWTPRGRPITAASRTSSDPVEFSIPGCRGIHWDKNRRLL